MTSIDITGKGIQLALALILCTSLASLFYDLAVLTVATILGLLLLRDLFDAHNIASHIEVMVKFEPATLDVHILREQKVTYAIKAEATREANVEPSINGLSIEPMALQKGKSELRLAFEPKLVGHYYTSKFMTKIYSNFRLFAISGGVPFQLEVEVYPKFMAAVFEALEFLMRRGLGGGGEEPTELRGPGMEYADTREYQPGDVLHRIDWKATARHAKLMVKEYYREGGTSMHIMYNLQAPGPVSHDELATGFINTLLATSERGTPISMTIHDSRKCLLNLRKANPTVALKMALRYVLQYNGIGPEDIYALLDPMPRQRMRRAFKRIGKKLWRDIFETIIATKGEGRSIVRALIEDVQSEDPMTQYIFITNLTGNVALLMDLVSQIARMGQVGIVYPARPWVDAKNLEEAYRMKVQAEKTLRALEKLSTQTHMLPSKLAKARH